MWVKWRRKLYIESWNVKSKQYSYTDTAHSKNWCSAVLSVSDCAKTFALSFSVRIHVGVEQWRCPVIFAEFVF